MSWNVSKNGTRDQIRQALDDEAHLPNPVADAIIGLLENFDSANDQELTATVATNGHINDGSTAGNISITITVP